MSQEPRGLRRKPLQGAVMFATVFLIGVVVSLLAALQLRGAGRARAGTT